MSDPVTAEQVLTYMRTTGWTERRRGDAAALWSNGTTSVCVLRELDTDRVVELIHQLSLAEICHPADVRNAIRKLAAAGPAAPELESDSARGGLRDRIEAAVDACCWSEFADTGEVMTVVMRDDAVDAAMSAIWPQSLTSPGERLRDILDGFISQAAFAKCIGISAKHLNQIISGKAPLSYSIAIRLERYTSVSAAEWNLAEAAYRDALLRWGAGSRRAAAVGADRG
jgi:plasmid maintenance system antidote protein VapI